MSWMLSKSKHCASENTIKKVVKPPTEWEKMLPITHLIRDLPLEYKKKKKKICMLNNKYTNILGIGLKWKFPQRKYSNGQ